MSKSNSRTFQGPNEGCSMRTTLTKDKTFISRSKHVQFTSTISHFQVLTKNWSRQIRCAGSKLKVSGMNSGANFLIVIGCLHRKSFVQAHCFRKSNLRTVKDFQTKIQELSRTDTNPDNNKNDNFISLPVPSQPADILAATSRPAIPILLQLRTQMQHQPDYHPIAAAAAHIHPSNFLAGSHHTHHYYHWTSSCCCHHDCSTNRCPVTRLIHRMNSASPLLLLSSHNHLLLTISHHTLAR